MVQPHVKLAQQYVRACAQRLELGHWLLTVEDGGAGEDYADVARIGTTAAHIKLYQQFWAASSDLKRLTVAHELMHLHTWTLAELVPDSHAASRSEVEERLVDTLADIIAPYLPSWRGRSWRQ